MITLTELEVFHGDDDRDILFSVILELLNGEYTIDKYRKAIETFNEPAS